MSHEIRTPLNSIVGFSNLLIGEIAPEKKNKYITLINKNSDTLLKLIEDILNIAKIEANQLQIKQNSGG